jgi:hypothetical protein
MKKFLLVVLLGQFVFGQATYSGRAQRSGSMNYGASGCGPGNGYASMNQTTGVVNFSVASAPNWGANTCDWTSIYTVEKCGNLYGAGIAQTPADFGTKMIRGTDLNLTGNPADAFETFDDPYPNAFELNDTAVIAKKQAEYVHVLAFNSATGVATKTVPDISVQGSANWAYTQPDTLFTFTMTPGVVDLYSNVVNLTSGSAGLTPTLMFHWFTSTCLTNSVNGYAAGNFVNNAWNGVMTQSLDDTTFAMAFSSTTGQGSGVYVAVWSVGQAGCDVYNTTLGTVTHNGVLVGSVGDQWGGSGGISDLFGIHDTFTSLNDNWVMLDTSPNLIGGGATGCANFGLTCRGTYNDGPYMWQKGTTNVVHCGIGTPSWAASTSYYNGDRINPSVAQGNAGDFIFQIVNGTSGTSGTTAPSFGSAQTVGQTASDNGLTWRNVGLPSSAQYDCSGHDWYGYMVLANGKQATTHTWGTPVSPQTILLSGATSSADQHFGSTNQNSTDTNFLYSISGAVDPYADLLHGTLPSPYYDEGFLIAPPTGAFAGTGVRRLFHTWNTGLSPFFDVSNGVCMLSHDGTWAMCPGDGMGQFGSTSGQASCNIGGPNWNGSDSTDFKTGTGYGSYMQPNSANAGKYVYHVHDCTANGGNGSSCTTGTTHPTWTQSSIVAGVGIIAENSPGTINWEGAPDVNTPANTAVPNCRAELIFVRLTR